jgi:hypothetical protein
LEEQTLTFKGLEEENLCTWNSTGALTN